MSVLIQKTLELFSQAQSGCTNSFLGLPHWFKYLKTNTSTECVPQLSKLEDIWLVGLAVIELLLRLAIYIGIAFVIYAGIKFSESGGNPEKATKAKNTLLDAIAGVVIAIVAVAVVSFIAGRFTQQ